MQGPQTVVNVGETPGNDAEETKDLHKVSNRSKAIIKNKSGSRL